MSFMVYFMFSSRKPHWHTQVYWLTWRSIVDSSQNKSGHLVQIAVFLVCLSSMLLWFSLFYAQVKLEAIQVKTVISYLTCIWITYCFFLGVLHALVWSRNTVRSCPCVCLSIFFFPALRPEVPLLGPIFVQHWGPRIPSVGTHCCTTK